MKHVYCVFVAACLLLSTVVVNAQISFTSSALSGESLVNPTCLQFGPDGRLYVSQHNGMILIYTIQRNGPNSYKVTSTETISHIKNIPNHNDDGTPANNATTRQVTGFVVTGTAANPVIFVTSSDPREGGGGGSGVNDKNIDTNSGIISKLVKNGSSWTMTHLVRGLPRSGENHSPNGLHYDAVNNDLYMAQGGNTNMGAPSNNFVNLPEYALSTAILKIDLDAIANNHAGSYTLPTLDDETRSNVNGAPSGHVDQNDPWGGNRGKNQAMLVPGSPVSVYSSGWRNNYDIVVAKTGAMAGKMYSFDNGPNTGWGGPPSNCSNAISEPGSAGKDVLHLVTQGYYAGHPNPTRASTDNKFNSSNPQSPVHSSLQNPDECTYSSPQNRPQALVNVGNSMNGLCEYTASNFNNAMKGDLLVTAFNGNGIIYRVDMNAAGTAIIPAATSTKLHTIASNFGNQSQPLDVIAQGDGDPFPGTIWCATFGLGNILIFEPGDFSACDPSSGSADSDGDGFTNDDEEDNDTDPCSSSDRPADADSDGISDLNDPDDDNDGLNDKTDPFALDASNGINTSIPLRYEFDNSDDGGIFGWGFTGLMTNGNTDYQALYDPEKMTVGGAALKFTVEEVPTGDAYQGNNNQQYGFQFGINSGAAEYSYILHSRIMGPFLGITPANNQSMGIFIGTGDQSNYLKVVLYGNGSSGGVQVLKEVGGSTSSNNYTASILNKSYVDLYMHINKTTNKVQPYYSIEGGAKVPAGSPVSIDSDWLSGVLAVGIISTSRGTSTTFPATWDFINIEYDPATITGNWYQVLSKNAPTARHECSFVQAGDKFYLLGGRGSKPVQQYDPQDSLWTTKANNPLEIHHFQAVEYNGLIYAICGLTGGFPHETPLTHIYIYDPVSNKWTQGSEIPAARRRGSAGVVVYNNKFYISCGIQDGHSSGWVNWLDCFDPQTNAWTQLANAPIARDHFNATVLNGKIYNIGGRRTGMNGDVFGNTIAQVDVYDIATNTWTTLPSGSNLPTPRAACATAVLNNEILVIGGESNTQSSAFDETEAFNPATNTWRALDDLLQGRHAMGAITSGEGVFVCAGSGGQGGAPELSTMEAFYYFNPTPPTGTAIVKGDLVANTIERFFGPVAVNASSTKTIKLTNTGGTQVILIDSIKLGSAQHFSFSFPNTFPMLLGVNQSVTFNVTFNPTSSGIKNNTLQVFHNGKNSTIQVLLKGEGGNATCSSNCVSKIWYADGDGDGFGYPYDSIITTLTPANFALNKGDCNDAVAAINPSATEILDGLDNNCNTAIDEGFGSKKVLFVVGSIVLENYDLAIKARMEHLGYEVTVISAQASTATHANGKDLIFISSSVNSDHVDNKFTNAAVPLINCEQGLYQDLEMCTSATTVYTKTQVEIVGTGHPLAAGLPNGVTTVLTSSDKMSVGVPNSNAAKIATVVGNSGQSLIFGYEAGAAMPGLTAPARRVGFFVMEKAHNLNTAGIALLDAALTWAIGEGTTVPDPAPQVAISAPAAASSFTAPANVTVTATASISSGSITKVEFYLNNALANTDNSSPYGYSITNLAAGSYTLYAKAYSALNVTTNSTTVNFTVNAPANPAPVVSLTAPTEGSSFTAPANVNAAATATISSGSISKVEFWLNNVLSSTDNSSPYEYAMTGLAAGSYTLYAKAYSALNVTTNSTTVNFSVQNAPVPTGNDALFVVGSTNLNSGDLAVKARLEALGFNVILKSATSSTTNDATGKRLVLLSSTTNSGDVTTKFSDVTVPVIVWEHGLFDDMKMTATGDFGNPSQTQNTITITNASHPLAAGLPLGNVQIYTSNDKITFGKPSANAISVATIQNSSSQMVSFGYETGATMVGKVAPARRVGIFLYDTGASVLTTQGRQLLDAAILWAAPPAAVNDCNGTPNGTAHLNDCGICVGGTTGLSENQGKDCAGVCNGTASLNSCNICVGGTTGLGENQGKDCAGVCNGTAYLNACSICVGGTTGLGENQGKDCNGDCGGTAHLNECNVCVGGNTGLGENQGKDCQGVCGGAAFLNECNICVSGTTGLTADEGKDCAGVCGGTAYLNECNVCVGGTTGLGDDQGKDCNGVCNGTAHLNACNICVGGTTGISENQGKDCAGVCDGTAFVNDCNMCVGGNTGLGIDYNKDCAGVCGGTAFIDDCNICVGGTTGLTADHAKDCHGDCNGTAILNECNICVGGNTGLAANFGKDCHGDCNGTAFVNGCGTCVGGNTGLPVNENIDCNDECNGTAYINSCGICVGGTTGLVDTAGIDCNGDCNGTAELNICGICVGGNTGLSLNEGKDCHGECDGDAYVNSCGFCVGGSTGFPTGMGIDCTGGCGDATVNECGICAGGNTGLTEDEGKDCNGDCNGDAFVNSCGICVGGNTGLVVNTGIDCTGGCGTAITNECGICVGGSTGLPLTQGKDCNGDCNGTALLNECNICVGGNTGLPLDQGKDCNGDCNGTALLNSCNICVGGNTGLSLTYGTDCNGDCGGTALLNECNICVGGNTGLPLDQGKDCNGDCNGTALLNSCNICVGGNTGLSLTHGTDCNGDCGGTASLNECNICGGGNTGLPLDQGKDCNGDCNGTALLNSCNICVGGNTGLTLTYGTDCNGECGGTASLNECNICVGGNTGLPLDQGKDCNGDCNGTAFLNSCNICVGGNTGLTLTYGTDCNGDCGGTATLDDCNICSGGNSGHVANSNKDCNGVCNGAAFLNDCNICVGGNTGLSANQGKDCNGDCGGTATLDACNICSGGNTGHIANSDQDSCGVCFGNGSSCAPPPCVFLEVVSFTLMHEGTAGEIMQLNDGDVINLFATPKFSIRANVCTTPVGSVKFHLNNSLFRTETEFPYALNGDSPTGSYKAWNASVGTYTLKCTPYSGGGGSGNSGIAKTITFTVINQNNVPDCNGTPGGTATLNSCGICVGGNTGLPLNQGKDCAGVCGGTAYLNTCNVCVGGNTGLGENQGKDCNGVCGGTAIIGCGNICVGGNTGIPVNQGKDCNGVCGGTAALDDCGVCAGGNTGKVPNANKDACGVCFGNGSSCAPCVPLQISSFTLMHTGTAGEIGPFTEGYVINLAIQNNFSLRADVCPGSTAVKSVKFKLNGQTIKTESTAPYAINGDVPTGNYAKWNINPGTYELSVIPYSGTGGSGTAGIAHTVNFTVINGASKTGDPGFTEFGEEQGLMLYPNPNSGDFNIEFNVAEKQDVSVRIFNHLGQVVYTQNYEQYEGKLKNLVQLRDQPSGMFFIQLQCGEKLYNEKVIVRQ